MDNGRSATPGGTARDPTDQARRGTGEGGKACCRGVPGAGRSLSIRDAQRYWNGEEFPDYLAALPGPSCLPYWRRAIGPEGVAADPITTPGHRARSPPQWPAAAGDRGGGPTSVSAPDAAPVSPADASRPPGLGGRWPRRGQRVTLPGGTCALWAVRPTRFRQHVLPRGGVQPGRRLILAATLRHCCARVQLVPAPTFTAVQHDRRSPGFGSTQPRCVLDLRWDVGSWSLRG